MQLLLLMMGDNSNKKYNEALPEMYKLVDKYKDGFVGKGALLFIENILIETERVEEILPTLERYSIGKSKVAEFAHYRKGYQYLYLKEYDKAVEIIKWIEFSEEDVYLKQVRLYDLGVINHEFLDNKLEGYNYFSELVKTYPGCTLSDVAQTFYRITKDGYEKPEIPQDEDKDVAVAPIETKMFVNYPNPFNPTTIYYAIQKDEFVKLTVYDITGRVVKELVNGHKNAGKHSVEFNASNYASGTYYYKLKAGEYKSIQKMMLVK